jgi:lauroyl/myristoyl acyltransferase
LSTDKLNRLELGWVSALERQAKRVYTGAMRTVLKKIRYRLEWLGLKFATKFIPLLSRKACYRLALLLGSLGAMLDRRGRRVALSNLRVAFGDEISAEGRAQIVRESYQHFARTMLDFFWSPRLTSQNFSRYGYARSRLSMIVRLRRSQRTS